MSAGQYTEEGPRWHDAVLHGDLRELDAALAALRGEGTPGAIGWMHALGAAAWFADPERGRLPARAELEPFTGQPPEVRAIAAVACAHAERAAALAFDPDELMRLVGLHRRLSDGEDGFLAAAECWLDLSAGRTGRIADAASAAGRFAAAARLPALVVEATVLRALAAAVDRDLESATSAARRASRMAGTEGLPQSQYLANAALARVRRITGKPHLATRILSALIRVATAPWQPWLAWELLLSRGHTIGDSRASSKAWSAVVALREALGAARAGDRASCGLRAAEARAQATGLADLPRDVDRLAVLLDAAAPATDPDLAAFCRGDVAPVPDGLYGVCDASATASTGGAAGAESDVVHVAVLPGQPGRRFLSVGLRLALEEMRARTVEPGPGRQIRTDSAIAALALAGPEGFAEDALFKTLYGFEYVAVHHKGARDVLYHRVRAKLGDAARIERTGGRIRLVHEQPLIVPDPRCSPPEEHSLLQILAETGHLSAKGASEALGIPIRTARRALQRLADDGACRAEKQGAQIEYFLEDTTFSEPSAY